MTNLRRIACLSFLLTAGICPGSVFAQRHLTTANVFRRYVTRLPDVDRIEITELKPVLTADLKSIHCQQAGLVCAPDTFPYQIGATRTLAGKQAKAFARFWRSLRRDRSVNDQCMELDHRLRFFEGPKLVLEIQVCAFCEMIALPGAGVVSVDGSNQAPYNLREAFVSDSELQQRRERFDREMMPQVGQQVSVIGLIGLGKGFLIDYGEWYIQLEGVDLTLVNKLLNLGCHTAVKVTGTLRYFTSEPGPPGVQRLPDHFYFDQPQIEVVRVDKPY